MKYLPKQVIEDIGAGEQYTNVPRMGRHFPGNMKQFEADRGDRFLAFCFRERQLLHQLEKIIGNST